ncbi:MAG: CHASE2 domain-containing protein [Candidatus Latescibacteria bacterium]|nr:CHASE2 domain-containing protein [Candidatus Latescibacterota bacterium]
MNTDSKPSKKKKRLDWPRYLGFGIGVSLLVVAWSYLEAYERLELRTLDERFVLRGKIPTDPNLGSVDIDDETVGEEGRFQDWTRDKHARLVKILADFGVRMVGFDIFFIEPSESMIKRQELDVLNEYTPEKVQSLFRDYDKELEEISRQAGNAYFSYYLMRSPNPDWDFVLNNTVKRTPRKEDAYQAFTERGFYLDYPQGKQTNFFKAVDLDPPLPQFIRAVKGVGFVQPIVDIDGVVRWYQLVRIYDQKLYPSISLIMLCDYFHVPFKTIQVVPGKRIRLPKARYPDGTVKDLDIPIDDQGKMLVNWAGDYEETFSHYPYARLTQLATMYAENVVLRDVKRLVYKKPELLANPELFLQEATAYNIGPPETVQTAYRTVWLCNQIEQALTQNQNLTLVNFFAAQGIAEPDIPPDLRQFFETIQNSLRIEALLKQNSSITLEQVAARLGIKRLDTIEHSFYAMKNLMGHGGIHQEDHPLIFFTVIHQGKELLPADLKDKVLIYGLTATGTQDLNPTPFNPRYPMLGYHVNALNTMITGQFLHRIDRPYRLAVILSLGVIMGLIVPLFGPLSGALVVTGLLAAQLSSAYYLFTLSGLWVDVVGPISVIILSYLTISVNNYIVERRERSYIQNSFKMYLSPAVVDQIARDPGLLDLGGQRKVLTVFFSDIAGFTSVSEKMSAEELVGLLNVYLGAMTEIIMQHQGTVDKYEGDAIMAFYGAPLDDPDHAVHACMACLTMQEKLTQLRDQWKADGRPDYVYKIRARMGMNTGPAVVGNMGCPQRMDYTVMGDTVNLASRLESGSKPYGTHITVSENTYKMAQDVVEARELDLLRVVGKVEPVTIYEILSRKGALAPDKAAIVQLYNEGLQLYRAQQWDESLEKLFAALKLDPNDGPSKLYIDRCERFKAEPVPEDFPVWTAKEK